MAIKNPKPVTIPAVPEKVFDSLFVNNITILADPLKPYRAIINSVPFSAKDDEVLNEVKSVVLQDIAVLAQLDKEFAMVVGGVIKWSGIIAAYSRILNIDEVGAEAFQKILELYKKDNP